MKKTVFLGIVAACVFSACGSLGFGSSGDAYRQPGPNETALIIQRNEMPVYSGFKERIYIDGAQKLVLTNGGQGRIIVPNGNHTIHADLYTLTSQKVSFTASSGTMGLMITPYSVYDFAIEDLDEDVLLAAIQNTPAPPVAQAAPPPPQPRLPPRLHGPRRRKRLRGPRPRNLRPPREAAAFSRGLRPLPEGESQAAITALKVRSCGPPRKS
jgi:hypothetical protein